jgi:hypothetical protein
VGDLMPKHVFELLGVVNLPDYAFESVYKLHRLLYVVKARLLVLSEKGGFDKVK